VTKKKKKMLLIGFGILIGYYLLKKSKSGMLGDHTDFNKLDISIKEDASLGLMNLISLEEHLMISAAKTDDTKYIDLLGQVRGIRQQVMEQLVKSSDNAETWCMSKHLLAAAMRFFETGSKYLSMGDNNTAMRYFKLAKSLHGKFLGLNCGCGQTVNTGASCCYGG